MQHAYLAGPDVFLPHAAALAAEKVAICARHGFAGQAPFNPDFAQLDSLPAAEAWRRIYRYDMDMMRRCDLVIANLTPFRGASADAGTLVELGWFLGAGKPIFAYSNAAEDFAQRSMAQRAAVPDPLPGLTVEGFGLPDNLMIAGAVEQGGGLPVTRPRDGMSRAFDALDVFELCVAEAAAVLAHRSLSVRN